MFSYKYPNFWKLTKVDRTKFHEQLKQIVDDSYYKKSNVIKRKMKIDDTTFNVEIDKKNLIVEVS